LNTFISFLKVEHIYTKAHELCSSFWN